MSLLNLAKKLVTSKDSLSKLGQIADSLTKTSNNVPVPMKEATQDMVSQITELMRIREIEQTKREEIVARKETTIAAINAQKEVLLEGMRHVFAERAVVLQHSFKVLDHALEKGDLAMLNVALGSMVQVIQTSPFPVIQQIVETKGTLRLE